MIFRTLAIALFMVATVTTASAESSPTTMDELLSETQSCMTPEAMNEELQPGAVLHTSFFDSDSIEKFGVAADISDQHFLGAIKGVEIYKIEHLPDWYFVALYDAKGCVYFSSTEPTEFIDLVLKKAFGEQI